MKILEVCAKLNIGGAQKVAANIGLYSDPTIALTYLVYGKEIGVYEQALIYRGCSILHWSEPKENLHQFLRSLIRLLRKERFDVVHCHTMFSCGLVMLAAKLAGAPVRVSHSHTVLESVGSEGTRKLYHFGMRLLMHSCGNEFFACGEAAGEALYGKTWFRKHGTIIPNGIDMDLFAYSVAAREQIRVQYQLEDRYVIGNVGHYNAIKNQAFLIELMPPILSERPDSALLLFGDGPDREALAALIEKKGLQSRVRLMGNVNNVHQVLSALDVFAFPSQFEGTPLALLEAQINGLPCVISDAVPQDACILKSIVRLPLLNKEKQWVDAIINAKRDVNLDAAAIVKSKYADCESSIEQMMTVFHKRLPKDRR